MIVPQLIEHVTGPWASVYNHSKTLVTLVTFGHFAGLLLGGGAAVVADRAALRMGGADDVDRQRYLGELHSTHRVVIVGMAMVVLTGLLMVGADAETFLTSRLFWFKILVVAALLANGALMLRAESAALGSLGGWTRLRASAAASLVLWFVSVLVGTAMATLG